VGAQVNVALGYIIGHVWPDMQPMGPNHYTREQREKKQ